MLLCMVLLGASALAQLKGTPASITSSGTPGKSMAPGVPASVTSRRFGLQGPDNCCMFPTPLIPSAMGFRNPAFNPGGREFHLQNHRPRFGFGGGYGGYYVPYAVPVYPDYENEQAMEAQQQYEPDPPAPTIFERRPVSAFVPPAPSSQPEREQAAEPAAAPVAQPERPQEPTVLIFKNGTRQEIQNFAIVGEMVYELSPEYRKIPLSDLNVPETVKENETRGAEFHVPAHKGS